MKCSNVPHLAMKATYGFIKVSTGFVRFLLENCGKTIDHVGVDRDSGSAEALRGARDNGLQRGPAGGRGRRNAF